MAKKKVGVTLDAALHDRVKSAAPLRRLNIEQVYDQALRQWLNEPVPVAAFSRIEQKWIDKLLRILASGNKDAIRLVTESLNVFDGLVNLKDKRE